jgi:Ca2+:H+ antiporter
LSIIPLAKLLAFATEELSLRVGQTLAGLLNATLGNAVELIVAIIALVKCELQVVQASLVGSVLSNLLLVLGMCFFVGGLKYSEQGFGASASQLNASLLTISVIAVLLPAAFNIAANPVLSDAQEGHDILAVSHGVAIILLFIYAAYISFQLYSHAALYEDRSIKTTNYTSPKFRMHMPRRLRHLKDPESTPPPTAAFGTESMESSQTLPARRTQFEEPPHSPIEEKDEEETPNLSLWMTIGLLVGVTVLVAVTAEWLVDSISGLTLTTPITKEFVGIILLPIVGNAAEHVTAVSVAVKDKLNLSIGVAVGSSIQIALFVIPFIVILGWILGKPLTLLFDPYESIAMFLAVLTVNYVVQDGKSNWLEGFILMGLYIILGVTFWFYPGSNPSGVLAACS